MTNKDERIKLINELLCGIKVLKLYAWEPIFETQVKQIRDREIELLRKVIYLRSAVSFVWCCAPFLVEHRRIHRNNSYYNLFVFFRWHW